MFGGCGAVLSKQPHPVLGAPFLSVALFTRDHPKS